jgi:hypothetical protein
VSDTSRVHDEGSHKKKSLVELPSKPDERKISGSKPKPLNNIKNQRCLALIHEEDAVSRHTRFCLIGVNLLKRQLSVVSKTPAPGRKPLASCYLNARICTYLRLPLKQNLAAFFLAARQMAMQCQCQSKRDILLLSLYSASSLQIITMISASSNDHHLHHDGLCFFPGQSHQSVPL